MRLFNKDEREALRSTFENEFGYPLPGDEAHIVGDDDSFVVVELLNEAGPWYIKPDLRNTTKAGVLIRKLAKYLLKVIPRGQSIIVVATSEGQSKVCRKIGMRQVKGTLWRLDR